MFNLNFADIFLSNNDFFYFNLLPSKRMKFLFGLPKSPKKLYNKVKLHAERDLKKAIKQINNYDNVEIRYCPYWGVYLPYFPISQVKKIYRCRDSFKEIFSKKKSVLSKLEKDTIDFVEIISRNNYLNHNNIGVTGSLNLNKERKDSDIDITIYGKENIEKVEKVISILKDDGFFRTPNENESWHIKNPFKEFFNNEHCNLNYRRLLDNSKRFNFKIIWEKRNRKVDLYYINDFMKFRKFKETDIIKNVKVIGRVIKDDESKLIPSSFIMIKEKSSLDAFNNKYNKEEIKVLSLINTSRLVRKGDIIEIRGNYIPFANGASENNNIFLLDNSVQSIKLLRIGDN